MVRPQQRDIRLAGGQEGRRGDACGQSKDGRGWHPQNITSRRTCSTNRARTPQRGGTPMVAVEPSSTGSSSLGTYRPGERNRSRSRAAWISPLRLWTSRPRRTTKLVDASRATTTRTRNVLEAPIPLPGRRNGGHRMQFILRRGSGQTAFSAGTSARRCVHIPCKLSD